MDIILTLAGGVAALVAGVFLAFSDFVMRGLAQAPGGAGALGMVGLNVTVYRSLFAVLLIALGPAALALPVMSSWRLEGMTALWVLAGAAVWLVGVVAVTGRGNIPLNHRLHALAGQPEALAEFWPDYVRRWTALNHLRVAGAGLAAVFWLIAAAQA